MSTLNDTASVASPEAEAVKTATSATTTPTPAAAVNQAKVIRSDDDFNIDSGGEDDEGDISVASEGSVKYGEGSPRRAPTGAAASAAPSPTNIHDTSVTSTNTNATLTANTTIGGASAMPPTPSDCGIPNFMVKCDLAVFDKKRNEVVLADGFSRPALLPPPLAPSPTATASAADSSKIASNGERKSLTPASSLVSPVANIVTTTVPVTVTSTDPLTGKTTETQSTMTMQAPDLFSIPVPPPAIKASQPSPTSVEQPTPQSKLDPPSTSAAVDPHVVGASAARNKAVRPSAAASNIVTTTVPVTVTSTDPLTGKTTETQSTMTMQAPDLFSIPVPPPPPSSAQAASVSKPVPRAHQRALETTTTPDLSSIPIPPPSVAPPPLSLASPPSSAMGRSHPEGSGKELEMPSAALLNGKKGPSLAELTGNAAKGNVVAVPLTAGNDFNADFDSTDDDENGCTPRTGTAVGTGLGPNNGNVVVKAASEKGNEENTLLSLPPPAPLPATRNKAARPPTSALAKEAETVTAPLASTSSSVGDGGQAPASYPHQSLQLLVDEARKATFAAASSSASPLSASNASNTNNNNTNNNGKGKEQQQTAMAMMIDTPSPFSPLSPNSPLSPHLDTVRLLQRLIADDVKNSAGVVGGIPPSSPAAVGGEEAKLIAASSKVTAKPATDLMPVPSPPAANGEGGAPRRVSNGAEAKSNSNAKALTDKDIIAANLSKPPPPPPPSHPAAPIPLPPAASPSAASPLETATVVTPAPARNKAVNKRAAFAEADEEEAVPAPVVGGEPAKMKAAPSSIAPAASSPDATKCVDVIKSAINNNNKNVSSSNSSSPAHYPNAPTPAFSIGDSDSITHFLARMATFEGNWEKDSQQQGATHAGGRQQLVSTATGGDSLHFIAQQLRAFERAAVGNSADRKNMSGSTVMYDSLLEERKKAVVASPTKASTQQQQQPTQGVPTALPRPTSLASITTTQTTAASAAGPRRAVDFDAIWAEGNHNPAATAQPPVPVAAEAPARNKATKTSAAAASARFADPPSVPQTSASAATIPDHTTAVAPPPAAASSVAESVAQMKAASHTRSNNATVSNNNNFFAAAAVAPPNDTTAASPMKPSSAAAPTAAAVPTSAALPVAPLSAPPTQTAAVIASAAPIPTVQTPTAPRVRHPSSQSPHGAIGNSTPLDMRPYQSQSNGGGISSGAAGNESPQALSPNPTAPQPQPQQQGAYAYAASPPLIPSHPAKPQAIPRPASPNQQQQQQSAPHPPAAAALPQQQWPPQPAQTAPQLQQQQHMQPAYGQQQQQQWGGEPYPYASAAPPNATNSGAIPLSADAMAAYYGRAAPAHPQYIHLTAADPYPYAAPAPGNTRQQQQYGYHSNQHYMMYPPQQQPSTSPPSYPYAPPMQSAVLSAEAMASYYANEDYRRGAAGGGFQQQQWGGQPQQQQQPYPYRPNSAAVPAPARAGSHYMRGDDRRFEEESSPDWHRRPDDRHNFSARGASDDRRPISPNSGGFEAAEQSPDTRTVIVDGAPITIACVGAAHRMGAQQRRRAQQSMAMGSGPSSRAVAAAAEAMAIYEAVMTPEKRRAGSDGGLSPYAPEATPSYRPRSSGRPSAAIGHHNVHTYGGGAQQQQHASIHSAPTAIGGDDRRKHSRPTAAPATMGATAVYYGAPASTSMANGSGSRVASALSAHIHSASNANASPLSMLSSRINPKRVTIDPTLSRRGASMSGNESDDDAENGGDDEKKSSSCGRQNGREGEGKANAVKYKYTAQSEGDDRYSASNTPAASNEEDPYASYNPYGGSYQNGAPSAPPPPSRRPPPFPENLIASERERLRQSRELTGGGRQSAVAGAEGGDERGAREASSSENRNGNMLSDSADHRRGGLRTREQTQRDLYETMAATERRRLDSSHAAQRAAIAEREEEAARRHDEALEGDFRRGLKFLAQRRAEALAAAEGPSNNNIGGRFFSADPSLPSSRDVSARRRADPDLETSYPNGQRLHVHNYDDSSSANNNGAYSRRDDNGEERVRRETAAADYYSAPPLPPGAAGHTTASSFVAQKRRDVGGTASFGRGEMGHFDASPQTNYQNLLQRYEGEAGKVGGYHHNDNDGYGYSGYSPKTQEALRRQHESSGAPAHHHRATPQPQGRQQWMPPQQQQQQQQQRYHGANASGHTYDDRRHQNISPAPPATTLLHALDLSGASPQTRTQALRRLREQQMSRAPRNVTDYTASTVMRSANISGISAVR